MSKRTRSALKSIDSKVIKVEPQLETKMNLSNKLSKLAFSTLRHQVKIEKHANGILDNPVKKELKIEIKTEPGCTENWEPTYWRKQLENIRLMRAKKDAPVDTMGCERTSNQELTGKVSF